ncbi:hypothetical protein ABPG75_001899 [Micractinium tetrahymenae]
MRGLDFNSSTPLYAASGLSDSGGQGRFADHFKALRLCSHVVAKEAVLPASELASLHSEQRALLDLLVLARAQRFVGTERSSFSWLAREMRLLRGLPRATAAMHPDPSGEHTGLLEVMAAGR